MQGPFASVVGGYDNDSLGNPGKRA